VKNEVGYFPRTVIRPTETVPSSTLVCSSDYSRVPPVHPKMPVLTREVKQTGEKTSWVCPYCPHKMFCKKFNLTRHIKETHEGMRRYIKDSSRSFGETYSQDSVAKKYEGD